MDERFLRTEMLLGPQAMERLAAAHVAGAVASLFGWGIVEGNQITMSQASVKSYLIRGAKRNPALRYPNEEWGYGALDLYETFRRIRE